MNGYETFRQVVFQVTTNYINVVRLSVAAGLRRITFRVHADRESANLLMVRLPAFHGLGYLFDVRGIVVQFLVPLWCMIALLGQCRPFRSQPTTITQPEACYHTNGPDSFSFLISARAMTEREVISI